MKNPAVLFNTSSVKAPQNSKNEDTDEKQYHTVVPLLIKEMVVNLPNKVTKYLTTQIVGTNLPVTRTLWRTGTLQK